jgi:hypothetical protein
MSPVGIIKYFSGSYKLLPCYPFLYAVQHRVAPNYSSWRSTTTGQLRSVDANDNHRYEQLVSSWLQVQLHLAILSMSGSDIHTPYINGLPQIPSSIVECKTPVSSLTKSCRTLLCNAWRPSCRHYAFGRHARRRYIVLVNKDRPNGSFASTHARAVRLY